jgi:hypothetical protein
MGWRGEAVIESCGSLDYSSKDGLLEVIAENTV